MKHLLRNVDALDYRVEKFQDLKNLLKNARLKPSCKMGVNRKDKT